MMQEIQQQHFVDDEGNPAGGSTSGRGISISWQNGPLQKSEGGTRLEPNGAFVEGVIAAAIGRLEHYQESKFACDWNETALGHLWAALAALEARTEERTNRGVEGTHEL